MRLAIRFALVALLGNGPLSSCSPKKKDKQRQHESDSPLAESTSRAAQCTTISIAQVAISGDSESGLIDSEVLGRRAGNYFAQQEWFALPGMEGPCKLVPTEVAMAIQVLVEDASAESWVAKVAVEGSLRFLDGGDSHAPRSLFVLEQVGKGPDMDSMAIALVGAAVEKASQSISDQVALSLAKDDELVQLASKEYSDPYIKTFALDLIGSRRLKSGLPLAIQSLASSETLVSDAAFAALVAIGDPKAIDALSSHADFRDHASLRAVIEGVRSIGGPEARDFLEFVESGHSDPDIQGQAREARQSLGKDEARSP